MGSPLLISKEIIVFYSCPINGGKGVGQESSAGTWEDSVKRLGSWLVQKSLKGLVGPGELGTLGLKITFAPSKLQSGLVFSLGLGLLDALGPADPADPGLEGLDLVPSLRQGSGCHSSPLPIPGAHTRRVSWR